jgi:hypothetical protein
MREYTKIMDRNQTRKAIKLYYVSNAENRAYVLNFIDECIKLNLEGVNNVCMNIDGGHFNFTYIGRKRFNCSTTFPELLEVR